jgi:hypothetical protein
VPISKKRRVANALGAFLFNRHSSLVILLALSCGAAACDGSSRPESNGRRQYGEPVGIRVEARGAVPALSVAFAVTKGRDPTPLVGPLATALYGAAVACPVFVSAMTAGKTVRLELAAEKNALVALGARPDEVGGMCMTAALGGKPVILDKADPLDVAIELKPAADASPRP